MTQVEQRVRKSRLRLAHYILYLFKQEFVFGSAAQRRRFADRMTRRLLRRLGYYHLTGFWFQWRLRITGLGKSGAERVLEQSHRQWLQAIDGLSNRELLGSWVTQHDRPHVIVLGMGSVGDILQITPVLRALHELLPKAEIVLLHRSTAAPMVLRNNPNISSIALADFHHFDAIKRAVAIEGTADVVVEIQSISYVVSYVRAPVGKRHPLIDQVMPDEFFTKGNLARERWQRHPPVFPRKDDKFVWPQEWRGYQYLDVLGSTGNLPIDRNAALDFTIQPTDKEIVPRLMANKDFVTVQNGVDSDVIGWSRVTGQRPTKLLPRQTWIDTVALLHQQGMTVVQLGTFDDELVDGVTLDLRGQTSLGEAAALLQAAQCHIGTEGGLVHLAYAVGTRSVVMFGPTSVEFLGYPCNVNLVASDCTSCWWTTKDWFIYCPRGLKEPECMSAHQPEAIVAAVNGVIAESLKS